MVLRCNLLLPEFALLFEGLSEAHQEVVVSGFQTSSLLTTFHAKYRSMVRPLVLEREIGYLGTDI